MLDFTLHKSSTDNSPWLETSLTGKPLLTIPQLNKGTAFTVEERHELRLCGKLPPHIETLQQQVERAYLQYQSYETPLQKNTFLNKLHDTNQVLFYQLVQDHQAEMIPIIYTPTVGAAVQKFSREFSQVRGLYICYEQRDHIEEILDNRSNPEIDLIVVSDGGGVLGIGDQGVGAMLIPVAKLMVYTICGGINPLHTLPILLDAGTNNETLLNDPMYLGWRHPRITEQEYDEFIYRFVTAIKAKFPHVFLQWEDFGRDNARKILDTYRNDICSFNDDIQGTGATVLAALTAAAKVTDTPLTEQRIAIFGAGNAGTGIADQICDGMLRLGMSVDEARQKFWLIDRHGLLFNDMSDLTPAQKPYARKRQEVAIWEQQTTAVTLLEVIEHIKPTVLIGCSAQTGAFTEEIIQAMSKCSERPIILPLSNPTEKAEATPQDILTWSSDQALIATGSPFPPVNYQGKTRRIAQCNNALSFPGIGLGAIAVKARRITDNMLWAACDALNRCAPVHLDHTAPLLPPIEYTQESAREIAIAVAKQAIADGVATVPLNNHIETVVDELIWQPRYIPIRKRADD